MTDRLSQKRRLRRRVVLALVVAVWLPACYVSSWCAFHWFAGYEARGGRDVTSMTWPQIVFKPLIAYLENEGPGDRAINILSVWCYYRGSGANLPWDEVATSYDELRRQPERTDRRATGP